MGISEKVQKDMANAMRARDERRLSTLRMMKAALKNRQVDKRAALENSEEIQVLDSLVKQRKDSIEQFTRGNRLELAEKEANEIRIIESYLPQAASEEEVVKAVRSKIAELGSPTMKDMGAVMKGVMAEFQASGARVDGKLVNDIVRRELSQRPG
jgi:uncharacterized protein YqeY